MKRHDLSIYGIFVIITIRPLRRQAFLMLITQLFFMQESFNYTTIVAPVAFFISGIFFVLLLNKFIGKNSGPKKTG